MGPARLNLPTIEDSLAAVQANFAEINETLSTPRDAMTDEVLGNLMAGYAFVDDAIAKGLDLLALGNSRRLLELNTLVLCGTTDDRRRRFPQLIAASEWRFYEQEAGGVGELMEWLARHVDDSVWSRAAGAYISVLSQPQLYIEGNHRTGALLMSYILAREGRPPFVLSLENAKAYFDPSSLVKETKKHTLSSLIRLPKLKKRFAKLLKQSADEHFLLPATREGEVSQLVASSLDP